MFTLYLLSPLFWVCVYSSIIDQRQTGDLNVQVDFKDVRIFALMKGDKEEYVDYDYAYDYSELTIKPQNRTTPKPFNGTSLSTEPTIAINDSSISSTLLEENTTATEDFFTVTTSPTDFKTTITHSESTSYNNSEIVMNKPSTNTPLKNCKRGFVLNQRGDCQFKLNSTGNALMKLVKLSQKLKLRRENKSNDSP
ncbi:uncharacterized protein LOC124533707 [Vanessa cardui]|uniref:uncharacterized protein LOC124533707 n=1 Tax=Vanessa cardui TaxID=171605 RepID=UPI001F12FE4C|nr:uncharacterized protein LOC124533707 [Vanessa cardui]